MSFFPPGPPGLKYPPGYKAYDCRGFARYPASNSAIWRKPYHPLDAALLWEQQEKAIFKRDCQLAREDELAERLAAKVRWERCKKRQAEKQALIGQIEPEPQPATPAATQDVSDMIWEQATPKTPSPQRPCPSRWYHPNTRLPGSFPSEEDCQPTPRHVFTVNRTARKRNRDAFERDLDENIEQQLTLRKQICFTIYVSVIIVVGTPTVYPVLLGHSIAKDTYDTVRENARPASQQAWQATRNLGLAFPGFVAQSAYRIVRRVNQGVCAAQRQVLRVYHRRYPGPPLRTSPFRNAAARESVPIVAEAVPTPNPLPLIVPSNNPPRPSRQLSELPLIPSNNQTEPSPKPTRPAKRVFRTNRGPPAPLLWPYRLLTSSERKRVGRVPRYRDWENRTRIFREAEPFSFQFREPEEDPDCVVVWNEQDAIYESQVDPPKKLPGVCPTIGEDDLGEQIARESGPDTPLHYDIRRVTEVEKPLVLSNPPPQTPDTDDVDLPVVNVSPGLKTSAGSTRRKLFGISSSRKVPDLESRQRKRDLLKHRQRLNLVPRRPRHNIQRHKMNAFKQLSPLREIAFEDITPPDSPATQLNTELLRSVRDDSDSDISDTVPPSWIPPRRNQRPITFDVSSLEKTQPPPPMAAQSIKDENAKESPQPVAAQSTQDKNVTASASRRLPFKPRFYLSPASEISSTCDVSPEITPEADSPVSEISTTHEISPGFSPKVKPIFASDNPSPVESKRITPIKDAPPKSSLKPETPVSRQTRYSTRSHPETKESEISSTYDHSPGPTPKFELLNELQQEISMQDASHLATPTQPVLSTPKATRHSIEKTGRQTRAQKRAQELISEKLRYTITPLNATHLAAVEEAVRKGHGKLSAADLRRVVPKDGAVGTSAWLNDETVNAYLELIVDFGKRNDEVSLETTPSHHAFNSFFYSNLSSKGYESVKRWGNRARIGGKRLLDVDMVFVPVNSGMHWTLVVVEGKKKTIKSYDSLGGSGAEKLRIVREWVRQELGSAWKEEEWKVEKGESGRQGIVMIVGFSP